jgi:uncharacterized protein YajQ (UPF0234 family)
MEKMKIKFWDRFRPVSRRQLIIIMDKAIDVIDGLIDDNNYHNTIELNLMNEINTLKEKGKTMQTEINIKQGIEVA